MTDHPLPASRPRRGSRLSVNDNGRYLEDEAGVPFFYLGDTAWTLFKRLDQDDAERYLANRAAKGFTVIQAYVLRGLEVTNLEGHLPLVDRDPTQLDEGFFGNIDRIVRRANELGLVMGMVATMGEHVKRRPTAERFKERNEQIFTVENAHRFGELLGKRYRDDCVIWLLGGDRNPSGEDIATWDAMAYGMKAGSAGAHLVSYHSGGGHSSSEYFHDKDWLDFNTVQSRHQSRDANYPLITADYALAPVKPTLDMECRYEDHPDARVIDIQQVFAGELDPDERVDAFDAREGAYWAVFAGAAGHGYGHNDIWQMADSRRVASTRDYSFPLLPPRHDWFLSIDSPGAFSISYLRRLVELRPWYLTEPDDSVLVAGRGETGAEDRASALRARDGSFVLAYLTFGSPVSIDLDRLSGTEVRGSWYDPRTGTFSVEGTYPSTGIREFRAPSSGRGNDWVLVLDDSAAGHPTS
jgi:hypothetical protein